MVQPPCVAAEAGPRKIAATKSHAPMQKWPLAPRYEHRGVIGAGAYGTVFEAWDTKHNRTVAVKHMKRIFGDLVDCKRICRELALLLRTNSDNIVKMLDMHIPGNLEKFDEIYYILEIADTDMKKMVGEEMFLTDIHIKTILYNMLVGVKYLHSAGIYHRDIKPANTLINQNCSVRICDFGLARAMGSTFDPLEQEVLLKGDIKQGLKDVPTLHVATRWYRAPELILLQENYTAAIDIWSVGCTFAELLCMDQKTCKKVKERHHLFPGFYCFPLSPEPRHRDDFRFHVNAAAEQLNCIFDVIGTPSKEDVDAIKRSDAKIYVNEFAPRPAASLSARFPGASAEALDLLRKMLQFNPAKRITVDESLAHPYLQSVRRKEKEISAPGLVRVPFKDGTNMDEKYLRYCFIKEYQSFHPEVVMPLSLERDEE